MDSRAAPREAAAPKARLRLLGAPAVLLPGGASRPLAEREAALLCLVAMRGEVLRAVVAGWAWPRAKDPANSLRQALHQLKERVGAPLVESHGPDLRLADHLDHDLGHPLEALRQDPHALRGALLGDAALAGLPLLAAEIEAERSHWAERLRAALVQASLEHEQHGRLDAAAVCVQRLVDDDPLDEGHAARLITLLDSAGQRSAALAAFERCKQALHSSLGVAPGDELVKLALAIGRRIEQKQSPGVADGHRGAALPPALVRPPLTHGREALVSEVLSRLATQPGAVLLTGMGGIGKTRVFDEVVQRTAPQVVCRLHPADREADLGLVGRLVAALPAAVRDAVPPGSQPLLRWLIDPVATARPALPMRAEALADWLRERFEAAAAAGAGNDAENGWRRVAIDDLHFADDASLELLAQMLRRSPCGLRWLLTSRDEPLPAPIETWLENGPAEDVRLPVQPLAEAAVTEWLASVPGLEASFAAWAAAMQAHCGGHPLSILHVLRTLHARGLLAAPAPPPQLPVPQQAMQRSTRLLLSADDRTQQLAFAAALAGSDFDDALAAELMHCSALELAPLWHRLQALGIFNGRAFSHELMRQAVVQAVPAALAPSIHRQIAHTLAAQGAAPARRAVHWEAAGDFARAAEDTARAGEDLLAGGLVREARRRLLHAAELHERAGARAAAFALRVQAQRTTAGTLDFTAAAAAAQALVEAAATPAESGDALCMLADALCALHDERSANAAQRAVDLAREHGSEQQQAGALLRRAQARRLQDRSNEALLDLEPLVAELSSLHPDDHHRAQGLHFQLLCNVGRRREAVVVMERRLAAAEAARDWPDACECANLLSIQWMYLCRLDEAHALALRTPELSRRAGYDEAVVCMDDMNLAGLCVDLGRLSDAVELCERTIEGLRRLGNHAWRLITEHVLANAFIRLGRLDLAAQRLPDAPEDAPLWVRALRRCSQARLAIERGEDGRTALVEALAMLGEGGVVLSPDVKWRLELECSRASGAEAALEGARGTLRWARAHEHVGLERLAGLLEVQALSRLDRAEEAAARADALLASFGGRWESYELYPPELWAAAVHAWDTVGRGDEANTTARMACEWIDGTARRHVRAPFEASFLLRNRHHRALQQRARRA
jgi:DNA-binding SARP family transcriptional activator